MAHCRFWQGFHFLAVDVNLNRRGGITTRLMHGKKYTFLGQNSTLEYGCQEIKRLSLEERALDRKRKRKRGMLGSKIVHSSLFVVLTHLYIPISMGILSIGLDFDLDLEILIDILFLVVFIFPCIVIVHLVLNAKDLVQLLDQLNCMIP